MGDEMVDTRDSIAKDQIQTHEKLMTEVYLDSLGNPTCGIGHLLSVGSYVPMEVVEAFFLYDYKKALRAYRSFKFNDVNTARRTALIDMIFNLGQNGFAKFTKMIEAIYNNDWDTVAKEAKDSKWYNQVGNRGKKIVKQLKTGVL